MTFTNEDARTVFTGINVNCWIFDPPYNIGFKYSNGISDALEWLEYYELIRDSCKNMYDRTNEGHSWMINYPEQSARLLPIIEMIGWELKQIITWVYPSNIGHSKSRFTTASRTVMWFVKGDPVSNIKATRQPYRNPNDKRIKKLIENGSEGVAHYDWWEINMRKNVSKGHAGWANQLPNELVKRIILTSTKDGDVVGDLMAGSGTTLEVAVPLGRKCWLNDIDPKAKALWNNLLAN